MIATSVWKEVSALSEYSTPVPTETENDGARAPDWADAMAQIDAEIDALRALLARNHGPDEASGDDGPADDTDDTDTDAVPPQGAAGDPG